MKICGIYYIKNLITNKYYIGSSVDIEQRWASHKSDLKLNKHHSKYLQRAYNKYGRAAFEFKFIESCKLDNNTIIMKEQYWMNFYKSSNYKYGYNLYPNARTSLGYKHSKETREKRKGIEFSEEHLKNLSKSHLGQRAWNTGKKHSKKHRDSLKRAWKLRKLKYPNVWNKGIPMSKEAKKKLSQALKGRIAWNKGLKLK
jgi:group I intron endonuclease